MILNLGTVSVAAFVVILFEHSIEQLVGLAIFLPVVAGMGGSGGIQTLTVITRAIALGEIEFSSGVRVVAKEMVVGVSPRSAAMMRRASGQFTPAHWPAGLAPSSSQYKSCRQKPWR